MAGKPDNFQLLEFQPKTVYLPDHGGNTGSLRRPPSAEDRRDQDPRYQMHPAVHPVRENEYARVPRRSSYDNREILYSREQDLPHPPEGMRQPLLQNPVYLLVPAGSMEGPGGKHSGDTFYARADGGPVLEEPGIRRRRTYVRERVVEPYPERRGCCSCWRCMIALIVILTIIGVGLAVTGIVFIKLINQQQQGQTRIIAHNGTSPREGSVRQAMFPMNSDSSTAVPVAFDVNLAPNGTDSNVTTTTTDGTPTLVTNITSNGTYDIVFPASENVTTSTPNASLASVNGTLVIINGTNSTDMTGIHVIEFPVAPNGLVNVSVQHHDGPTPNPNGAAFDVDTASITTVPSVAGITFSANMGVVPSAAAFLSKNLSDVAVAHVAVHPNGTMVAPSATPHHNDPEHLPTPQNLTLAHIGAHDTQGHAQRAAEEEHRMNVYKDWNTPVGLTRGAAGNSSGATSLNNP